MCRGRQGLVFSIGVPGGERGVNKAVDWPVRWQSFLPRAMTHQKAGLGRWQEAPTADEPGRPVPPHHRTTLAAQVKPAPKATRSTLLPGLMTPVRLASSRAMAQAAALVLPNF